MVAPANQIFFKRNVKPSNQVTEDRKPFGEAIADRQPVDIHHPKDKRGGAALSQLSEAVERKERRIGGDDNVGRERGGDAGDGVAVVDLLKLALKISMFAKDASDPHAHDIQAGGVARLTV
jgi:hypothetical protein